MSRWLRAVSLCGIVVAASSAALASSSAPKIETRHSVREAYDAIPHRRTVARLQNLSLPGAEREFLAAMFEAIDLGVANRVDAFSRFASGDSSDTIYFDNQDRLIDYVGSLLPPSELADYHRAVLIAMESQRAFFVSWRDGRLDPQTRPWVTHPKVHAASRALQEAYSILMRHYPQASSHNKNAFFDYHCALDFL